jgi:hypothetical protein
MKVLNIHFSPPCYFLPSFVVIVIIVIIIIIGWTSLQGPWPSSKASSTLPYLMPKSSKSFLLKS